MVIKGYSMRAPNPEKPKGVGKMVELQASMTIQKNPNGTYMVKGKCPDTGNTVCSIQSGENGLKVISEGLATEVEAKKK